MKCPKCWAESRLTWEAVRRGWPYDDDPPDMLIQPVQIDEATLIDAFYECPAHGEFGFGNDNTGSPHFIRRELKLVGPDGRAIYLDK